MMSSNTLGNTDFNAINGAVPPPIRKATLQKENKVKLAENPPDKFERTASPRKAGEDTETTATTVAEPKKDVLPLVFSGLALAGTIGLGLFTLFRKPEEATSTAGKVVDEVAQREIKELRETIATQAQELAEKATKSDFAGVKNSIQQTVDNAVNTATSGIQATLATHESNLDYLRTNAETVIASLQESVSNIQKTVDRTKQQITSQGKGIEEITQRLDATIPVIGNNVVVDRSVKDYFVGNGLNNLAATLGKSEALNNSVTQLTNYIRKSVLPKDGFEKIQVDSFIHQLFDYLKETQSTKGNTTYSLIHKMSHILDEVPRSGYDIFTINPTKKLPKADYIPALMDTLEYVQNVYNGVPTDENIFKLTSSTFISETELKQKINAVLDAAAKENGGSKEKANQAQAELMTWLEDIFTKTRPEIFERNTNGKKPLKELPAPHPSSDWVIRDKFFEGDKPLVELTQTLLGKGFKGGEGAENPYTLTDVAILSDTIGALQRALMKEQGYTLENGVLQAPENVGRSELARTVNRIAKTLIPIDNKAIEGGLVPLRAVEVDPKKPYLPEEMWNARLNGNADGVKAVTAKMFEELRRVLLNGSVSDFMVKHPLTFPITDNYGEGVNDFLSQKCGIISVVAPKVDEMITNRGEDLPQGTDFVQTVINKFFEAMESCAKRKTGIDTYPQTLYNFYEKTFDKLILNGGGSGNVQQWRDSSFAQVLKYSARVSDSGVIPFTYEADKMSQLINWQHFPDLKARVQAVISARTESVEAVKAKQTELMAFLKRHFYEKPTDT